MQDKSLNLVAYRNIPPTPIKFVLSLTQGNVHTVEVFESSGIKCDNQCNRFNSVATCTHCLSVSTWLGTLVKYVTSFTPDLDKMTKANLPKQAGKNLRR